MPTQPNYKTVAIDCENSGDNLVLTSTRPINIFGVFVVSDTALYATFKNGSTVLSGPQYMALGGDIQAPPAGFIRYVVGPGLTPVGGFYINLSTAGKVAGTLYYTLGGMQGM